MNSIAYLSAYWTQTTISTLFSLRALRVYLPQVSPGGLSDYLNQQSIYPEYIKLTGKFDVFLSNFIFLFRFYNWKDVMILVSNTSTNIIFYNQVYQVLGSMGIKIVNTEETRFIPESYTRDDFENYKQLFAQIKSLQCRILLLLLTDPGFIFEALYDIGLRKGDLIVVANTRIHFTLLSSVPKNYQAKREEIYTGALISNNIEYEGEYGQLIEKELRKKNKLIINMCMTYDGFKTISNSAKYLILKGEDYEDHSIFMNTMRTQKFIGCSGEVFFIPSENSRNKPWLGLLQLVINSTTSEFDFVQIAKFNKFAVIAAELINNPVWPTGEDSVPSNYRVSDVCLYKNTSQSPKSFLVLYIFSFISMIVVIISSYFSMKKFENEVTAISNNVHLSYSEIFHYFFIVCHFFQILALEPSGGLLNKTTNKLNLKLGLDFLEAFDWKLEDYWKFYLILIAIMAAYIIETVTIVIIDKFCVRIMNSWSFFKFSIEYILPLAGHLGFMPLILMMISIFKCESQDDSYDLVFSKDCTKFCYKGKHLLYLISGSILIMIYLSISTLLRPYWELQQSHINIKTKVYFFSYLSIFQYISI